VKDYYCPSIAGVGYIGKLIQKDHKREYSIWKHMLHRCYNEYDDNYHKYGFLGVSVAERWFDFENFVVDIPSIENYDKILFDSKVLQLDKDKKQIDLPIGKRIYSLETCCFLTAQENLFYSRKNRKVGDIYEI